MVYCAAAALWTTAGFCANIEDVASFVFWKRCVGLEGGHEEVVGEGFCAERS